MNQREVILSIMIVKLNFSHLKSAQKFQVTVLKVRSNEKNNSIKKEKRK
jgi:hypothetical protein